ncbi:MAG: DUF2062 domain-containing protein [Salinirussus sp.]
MSELLPGDFAEFHSELESTFAADRPPRQIALSFAIGLFLIALPNLGASLVVLAGSAYQWSWADARAFSAAALILNPLVKSGVYVASFALGILLLGPVPGGFIGQLDLTVGVGVLTRLIVGNLVLALAISTLGYVVGIYLIRKARDHADAV